MKDKIIEVILMLINITAFTLFFLFLKSINIFPPKYLYLMILIYFLSLLIPIVIYFIPNNIISKINILLLTTIFLITTISYKPVYKTNNLIENKFKSVTTYQELKPFNILISGSDSRINNIEQNTRSDVNIIVTVNPNNHKIILTSIPRDYYIPIHNTKYQEKLTNIGVLGLDTLSKSLEDLLNIKIDYYIKAGFKGVESLIDILGGIDINNEIPFSSYISKDVYFSKGLIHLNGYETILYARERKSFPEGDLRRIKNHQVIIKSLINKIYKDKTYLLKYNEIMKYLNDTYITDIPLDLMKDLIRRELDSLEEWQIDTITLTGEGTKRNTYLSKYKQYVMLPELKEIEKTSTIINNLIIE